MPDLAARRELFVHYLNRVCTGDPAGRTLDANNKPILIPNINDSRTAISNVALADLLANRTPGLSPATIATVVNEAALQSGIAGKSLVDMPSIMEAVDNTLMGRKHRNRQSTNAERRTAIHEAGHALTA
uniref:ATP-dependent zinc metalloprotease FtsH n=1 Tax=Lygus hesperus TaxID=30085 RepID=A0A0A9VQ80_LYGHE